MNQNFPFTTKSLKAFFKNPVLSKPKKLRRNSFTLSYSGLKIKLAFLSSQPKFLSKNFSKNLGFARTRDERLQHASLVAQAANFLELPENCLPDKGRQLYFLIEEAILKKQAKVSTWKIGEKRDTRRVTSLELWQFAQKYKNIKGHVASRFKEFDEKSFRLLSKEFLQPVDLTTTSLAKCLSDYGSFNSLEHKAFLAEIGLDKANATTWITEALKNRCFLNIHSFELSRQTDFRITYHVPVLPVCKGKFNLSLLSLKVVIEYPFIRNSISGENPDGEYESNGKIITMYLQNRPFGTDDEETLQQICPGTEHWGGSQVATDTFILALKSKRGLPGVTFSTLFPIFRTTRSRYNKKKSKANIVEDQYLKLKKSEIPKIPYNERDIDSLSRDPAYTKKAYSEFYSIRIKIIILLQNFYQQL